MRCVLVVVIGVIGAGCGQEPDAEEAPAAWVRPGAVGTVSVASTAAVELSPYKTLRMMLLSECWAAGVGEASNYSRNPAYTGYSLEYGAVPPFDYQLGGVDGCDACTDWFIVAWLSTYDMNDDGDLVQANTPQFDPARDPYGFVTFVAPESYTPAPGGYATCYGGIARDLEVVIDIPPGGP
jgi:hypothetical protein